MVDENASVVGVICHIHARRAGGARFDNTLPLKLRQSEENLILLCGTHHKVIDDNPTDYDAQTLREIKAAHNAKAQNPDAETFELFAKLLLNRSRAENQIVNNAGNVAINSPGAVQAQVVNIKQGGGKVTIAPPDGTIGARADMASYVKYLIAQYNDFAKKEPSRTRKFHFGVISTNITKQFGAQWALVSEERFEEVCSYLTGRIQKTRIAKWNNSKGHGSFHSFEEHLNKQKG